VSSATFEDLSGDGVNLVGEPGTLHVRLLAQTRQTLMNAAVLVSSETPGLEFMPTRFELGTVEAATTQSADFQYTTSGATCGDELRAALSVVWDGNFSEAAAGPEPFGQIRPFSFAAEESPGVAIPDADPAGVTRSLAVGAMPGHTVETVDVTVDITHPYVADLQIDLVGPDDELVNLFTGGNADNHADLHRTFTLTRYQGQEADGTYQLTVRDRVAEDAGTLDHWGVTLHTTARVCDPWSVEQLILELLGIDAGATETDINKDGRFDVADVLALMSTIPRPTELSDRDR
jgi:subtilisin-like proprotein convertase family protein